MNKTKTRLLEDLEEARRALARTKRKLAERMSTEAALLESKEILRSLFDNSLDAILLTSPDGGILAANPAACRIFERTEEDICRLGRSGVIDTSDPRFAPAVEERARIGSFVGELTGLRADGAPFPIDVSTSVFKDRQGRHRTSMIIRDLTERKRAAAALRKSESNLRALALDLSFTEERDRKRLAIFLHDEIGQPLALLQMMFGRLAASAKSRSNKRTFRQVRDLLDQTLDQTRSLTFDISPPILHQLGLEAAIEWAGEKISRDHGIEFTFSDDGTTKPLEADVKALMFRSVRELMTNIVKHAKARRISVALTQKEERIFVVVEDDGIGFDVSILEGQQVLPGFGLFSVREQLAALGGSFHLQAETGRGTQAILSIPLKDVEPSS